VKILVAPDSFKECLSASAVARAIAHGVRRVMPDAEVVELPVADGGEGTVDAMVAAAHGRLEHLDVMGPLGAPVRACYGWTDAVTAVIEMAEASGLHLLPPEERDPLRATTYGTGQIIAHALDHGATTIIVGLGGSATNDGGAGMAQALGYCLLDAQGNPLEPGGAALRRLARIETGDRHPRLAACSFRVACDVTNPLCGPNGASHIYGPQKGATSDTVEELEAALAHYATAVRRDMGVDVKDLPGAGAAGGLGGGLVAFCGATLESGFALVAETCGMARHIAEAGLIITGEGKLDRQSLSGKAPIGVARLARQAGVPVVAIAGCVEPGFPMGSDAEIQIPESATPHDMPFAEACLNAPGLIADATQRALARFFSAR
jgi:glycerate kinase